MGSMRSMERIISGAAAALLRADAQMKRQQNSFYEISVGRGKCAL